MICEKIETERYTIYCADCLEVMPTLAASSVQTIITDLPYGTTACPFTNYPSTVLSFPNEQGGHSTQKPVALMEYLVRTHSDRDDVVFDSTMGSGTTGVACLKADRKFIGIEIDPKFFALAASRLSEASEEPPLFKTNETEQLDLAFSPSNI